MKRTFQPSNLKRARTHGFLSRMSTAAGRNVIKRRRAKGRKKTSPSQDPRTSPAPCSNEGLFPIQGEERILHRKDFIRRLPEDRKRVFSHFLVVLKPNNLGRTRLGLTVGKDKGIAVQRNRIKRILREFFRRSKNRLPPSPGYYHYCFKRSELINISSGGRRVNPPLSLMWALLARIIRGFLLMAIRGYQRVISPFFPSACRYYPTCSEYTFQALQTYGLCRGIVLSLKRIGRCHPFSPGGFDPSVKGRYSDIDSEPIEI